MKKYLVLSRAIKNFGDFLIFERGVNLIKLLKPNVEVVQGKAWIPLDEQFSEKELSSFDAVVIPGGPGIRVDIYPEIYPLSKAVFKNSIPVYFLGGAKIYPYLGKDSEKIFFSPNSLNFLK